MEKLLLRTFFVLGFSIVFIACDYFEKSEDKEVLARVNESYLYKEDIESLVDESISKEDSILIVTNFINRWATQQLLIDRAKYNLSLKQQQEFEDLVRNYKNELYTKAYADALVAKQLDTSFESG
jgi:hypothetical protein